MHPRTNFCTAFRGDSAFRAFLEPNIDTDREGHRAQVRKVDFHGFGIEHPSSLQP